MLGIDTLPRVEIEVDVRNPNWKAEFQVNETGLRIPTNSETYYVKKKVSAEVLTVNLNKGTMRVRYQIDGNWKTPDVSSSAFFAKYQITERES